MTAESGGRFLVWIMLKSKLSIQEPSTRRRSSLSYTIIIDLMRERNLKDIKREENDYGDDGLLQGLLKGNQNPKEWLIFYSYRH